MVALSSLFGLLLTSFALWFIYERWNLHNEKRKIPRSFESNSMLISQQANDYKSRCKLLIIPSCINTKYVGKIMLVVEKMWFHYYHMREKWDVRTVDSAQRSPDVKEHDIRRDYCSFWNNHIWFILIVVITIMSVVDNSVVYEVWNVKELMRLHTQGVIRRPRSSNKRSWCVVNEKPPVVPGAKWKYNGYSFKRTDKSDSLAPFWWSLITHLGATSQ